VHAPLTFGDLAHPGEGRPSINLQMMTTNLMMRRPYTLPFSDQVYSFKPEDFAKLFPKRILDHLLTHSEKIITEGVAEGEYYRFPPAEALPIVVAARMSLSFPLLITAVPLYAHDHTLTPEKGGKLQRCLFSDGGLSSNFPIHFFDHMLPMAPTFGISLGSYDPARDFRLDEPREPRHANVGETRVWMPDPARASSGILLPIEGFEGLFGFLMRLIDAAKDWQDNLQSTLAGYRDRIVHVYLKPNEGGLNLVMPPEVVGALGEYGAEAGEMARTLFDFDEHRWRRFLVAMDRLDQSLEDFAEAYKGVAATPESFKAFLARYLDRTPDKPMSYRLGQKDLELLLKRADALAALGDSWKLEPSIPEQKLPHPKTDLRITPKP
jgi:hypothetical protein